MPRLAVIFISTLFLSTTTWAIEPNQQQNNVPELSLPTLKIIEHSNLNTENYIWKIQLLLNLENKSISSHLINPHPAFPMLNQRALELAQNHLAKNYNDEKLAHLHPSQLENLRSNTTPSTPQHTQSYMLNVKFQQGVAWKIKPRFQELAQISAKFCKLQPQHPNYENAIIRKDRHYTFQTKLYINANGVVKSVELLNPSADTTLNKIVQKELSASRFQPYNENGIPTAFLAEQPIQLVCPN